MKKVNLFKVIAEDIENVYRVYVPATSKKEVENYCKGNFEPRIIESDCGKLEYYKTLIIDGLNMIEASSEDICVVNRMLDIFE